MTIRIVGAILLVLFSGAHSLADEYLLTVETVGLRHLENGGKEPEPRSSESVELVVRSKNSFYSKTKVGKSEITISGTLKTLSDEKLQIKLHYESSSDTGKFVPVVDGKKQPVRKAFVFDIASELVKLGEPIVRDSLVSTNRSVKTALLIKPFGTSKLNESGNSKLR